MNAALDLFVFTLGMFGFAYIVGHSKISLPFREMLAPPSWVDSRMTFEELLIRAAAHNVKPGTLNRKLFFWALRKWILSLIECPACLGFWLGLLAGVAYSRAGGGSGNILVTAPSFALYVTATNFLLARFGGLIPTEDDDAWRPQK